MAEAAQAIIGSGFGAKKCIRMEDHACERILFSSNSKDVTVDAGRAVEVDWAYAVFGISGTTPDVTIRWETSQGMYSQLVVEGSLIKVHADGTHDIFGPGSWKAP